MSKTRSSRFSIVRDGAVDAVQPPKTAEQPVAPPRPEKFGSVPESNVGVSPGRKKTPESQPVRTMLLGVGGCGNNTVRYLSRRDLGQVKLCAANTDAVDLEGVELECGDRAEIVPMKIPEEEESYGEVRSSSYGGERHWGAGGEAELGEQAAKNCEKVFRDLFQGVDLLVLVAGMGGGTGTGAAPVIAQFARQSGVTIWTVVTMPYEAEGPPINRRAQKGLSALEAEVDSLVVISNQRLMACYGHYTETEAYEAGMEPLTGTICLILDILNPKKKLTISVDFRDIQRVLSQKGRAAYAECLIQDLEKMVEEVSENLDLACQDVPEQPKQFQARGMLAILPAGTTMNQKGQLSTLFQNYMLWSSGAVEVSEEAKEAYSRVTSEESRSEGEAKVRVLLSGLHFSSEIGAGVADEAPPAPQEDPNSKPTLYEPMIKAKDVKLAIDHDQQFESGSLSRAPNGHDLLKEQMD